MNEFRSEYLRRKEKQERLDQRNTEIAERQRERRRSKLLGVGIAAVGLGMLVVLPMRFRAIADDNGDPNLKYMAANISPAILEADSQIDAKAATLQEGDVQQMAEALVVDENITFDETAYSIDAHYAVAGSDVQDQIASGAMSIEGVGDDERCSTETHPVLLYDADIRDTEKESIYYVALIDDYRVNNLGQAVDVKFSCDDTQIDDSEGIIYDDKTGIVYVPKGSRFVGGATGSTDVVGQGEQETETVISDEEPVPAAAPDEGVVATVGETEVAEGTSELPETPAETVPTVPEGEAPASDVPAETSAGTQTPSADATSEDSQSQQSEFQQTIINGTSEASADATATSSADATTESGIVSIEATSSTVSAAYGEDSPSDAAVDATATETGTSPETPATAIDSNDAVTPSEVAPEDGVTEAADTTGEGDSREASTDTPAEEARELPVLHADVIVFASSENPEEAGTPAEEPAAEPVAEPADSETGEPAESPQDDGTEVAGAAYTDTELVAEQVHMVETEDLGDAAPTGTLSFSDYESWQAFATSAGLTGAEIGEDCFISPNGQPCTLLVKYESRPETAAMSIVDWQVGDGKGDLTSMAYVTCEGHRSYDASDTEASDAAATADGTEATEEEDGTEVAESTRPLTTASIESFIVETEEQGQTTLDTQATSSDASTSAETAAATTAQGAETATPEATGGYLVALQVPNTSPIADVEVIDLTLPEELDEANMAADAEVINVEDDEVEEASSEETAPITTAYIEQAYHGGDANDVYIKVNTWFSDGTKMILTPVPTAEAKRLMTSFGLTIGSVISGAGIRNPNMNTTTGAVTVTKAGNYNIYESSEYIAKWTVTLKSSANKEIANGGTSSLTPKKEQTLYTSISTNNNKHSVKFSTTAPTATITFDKNTGSGTMGKQTVTVGKETTLNKNTFTKSGYTFNGWNTKKDGTGTKYANTAKVKFTHSVTLYAQWKKNTAVTNITVTFNSNSGTGTMSKQTMKSGTATKLTPNKFSKSGHTFNGWNTKTDGKGTGYTNQQSVKLTKNTTLYAQWKKNATTTNITVTFNANGGTGTMSKQTMKSNTSTKLVANAFKRSGYAFTGWNTKKDGSGTKYANQASVKLSKSVTLYAQWKKTVTVTFNSNSGTGTMNKQTIQSGVATKLTKNAFSKTGYTFNGWNTKKDGKGTKYANQASVKLTKNTTLYAQWKKAATITVTFNSNGGAGTMSKQTMTSGVATKLSPNKFSKTGYGFTGWNTKKDGKGTKYANQASVKLTSNTTLYAQWTKTVTVTFNANSGTGTMGKQTMLSGTATKLDANKFKKSGYTFNGWNTKKDGKGTKYTNQQSVKLSKNTTLYAQWKKNDSSTPSTPSTPGSPSTPSTPSTPSSPSTPTNPQTGGTTASEIASRLTNLLSQSGGTVTPDLTQQLQSALTQGGVTVSPELITKITTAISQYKNDPQKLQEKLAEIVSQAQQQGGQQAPTQQGQDVTGTQPTQQGQVPGNSAETRQQPTPPSAPQEPDPDEDGGSDDSASGSHSPSGTRSASGRTSSSTSGGSSSGSASSTPTAGSNGSKQVATTGGLGSLVQTGDAVAIAGGATILTASAAGLVAYMRKRRNKA